MTTSKKLTSSRQSTPLKRCASAGSAAPAPAAADTTAGTADPNTSLNLPFTAHVGESNEAFQSFLCYFDIGKARSLGAVAKRMRIHPSTVKRWATQFKWRERIQAFQEELLRSRMQLATELQKNQAELWLRRNTEWQQIEWDSAIELVATAKDYIQRLKNASAAEISLLEVARALEIASKLARNATGQPTEKHEHTGANRAPIQIEISAALDKIYGPPMKDAKATLTIGPGTPEPAAQQENTNP